MSNNPLSLIEQIASEDYLLKSWKALNKSNKSSRGLSNISIKDFEDNLSANLASISKSIISRTYAFSKVRAVTIDKSNSVEKRPLRVGEIKDRLVQKALATQLDKLLSEKFNLNNECSFAYRKGKNVEDAIAKMVEYYNQGFTVILEADIKKFFDTVVKSSLLEQIQKELPDNSINSLLKDAITQEIGNSESFSQAEFDKYFSTSEDGIPQGNALSPLLANIYLSAFDNRIINDGLKMVRYADDFIIMCKNRMDAETALLIAKEELEKKLDLEIHLLGDSKDENAKTRIVNPTMHKFSFLSIRFDGNRCWVKDKKVISIIEKIEQITEVKDAKNKSKTYLLPMLNSLKNTVEGWIAAYHFVDLSKNLTEIDNHINRRLYLALLELGFAVDKKSLASISLRRIRKEIDAKGNEKKSFVIGRSNEVLALNKHQRIHTGIPYCHKVWERMQTKEPE